ncbi:hypothetical protein ASE73_05260 [Sphingomonas sp. Leaf24]|uniref:DUF418 domain-containing protein n=1 Tax=unclassified Sphingomonas TaxID=196159 RepID=UPI0006F34D61|nr:MULTISPECIES: DUF418 domain-containing protein [unclassified Sphingomonas]KQM19151.1 hypothetical protein ASE50_17920 [Sphingomonas sp. Leaf5]KQM90925.1 hypothetical protein ASE73_05260 [Sphingomonas sp. Leaf24]
MGRIATIDTVRGVAVMGILFLNILAFALPEAAYISPRAYGLNDAADRVAYYAVLILFDGKMRGLFSFLFGASLLLVADRAEAAGRDPAAVHYARMGWLFVLGLAHAALLWRGDILAHYALIGSVAYAFRALGPGRLLAFGIAFAAVDALLMGSIPLAYLSMQASDGATAAQNLRDFRNAFGVPAPAVLAQELALYRGSYAGILAHNLAEIGESLGNTLIIGFETLAYMLFGMAALRSGMLDGRWSRRRLWRWAIGGMGIGLLGYGAIAVWIASRDLDVLAIVAGPIALATPVRAIMIPGWAATIVLLAAGSGPIARRFATAGRMALSNYLATSIVMCFLFYGWGLGQFGHWSRASLYLPVFAMCAAILLWSPWWLARFRYGPFEWLWRSLARRQWQPMRSLSTTPAR